MSTQESQPGPAQSKELWTNLILRKIARPAQRPRHATSPPLAGRARAQPSLATRSPGSSWSLTHHAPRQLGQVPDRHGRRAVDRGQQGLSSCPHPSSGQGSLPIPVPQNRWPACSRRDSEMNKSLSPPQRLSPFPQTFQKERKKKKERAHQESERDTVCTRVCGQQGDIRSQVWTAISQPFRSRPSWV